jgi:large subunit ribosomal protein L9
MAKSIQLILNQDVPKLGKLGDVVEVAPGYARNYLVPKNIAVRSTPGLLRQAEVRKEKERQRLLELKKVAETQKVALEKVANFTITKQVGENESIFGTVTAPELVTLIKNVTGLDVDRRDVEIPDINKLGTYAVEIKLHPDVTATVNVVVAA